MELRDAKPVNLVIVGHVDHGKSTLIGRLLFETDSLCSDRIEELRAISGGPEKKIEFAHLLDHLEEERSQGITIDTTEVFFDTGKRSYAIIDAPGHVEFVRNMITGASHAEAAVLVVDACDGVREQTRRHATILSLLGIERTIVVLNKMDLVRFEEKRFIEAMHAVGAFLGSIDLDPVCYIPVCAVGGDNVARKSENMRWYGGPSLLDSLDALEEKRSDGNNSLIFPVQDVYEIEDTRIAVGRVESGTLRRGARIKILPGGQTTEILSVERYPDTVEAAGAGQCAGLVTAGTYVPKRGDVICTPGREPLLIDAFEGKIIWMSEKPLRKGQILVLRCATQETPCTVERIKRRTDSSSLELMEEEADILQNTEVGEVVIKTDRRICIAPFSRVRELGRFVIVEGEDTCAGGIITQGDRRR